MTDIDQAEQPQQPQEQPAPQTYPVKGGSYTRDPITGELTRHEPEPEPEE